MGWRPSAGTFSRCLCGTRGKRLNRTGEVIEGSLPKVAANLVREWTLARQRQLRENWRRARAGEQPERMRGLDAD
jgi:hypothetical protein